MRQGANRIAKNSVFSIIARLSEGLAGIITIILATRYLGVSNFGEYAYIRVIAFALSSIIAFGSIKILIREIAVKKEQAPAYIMSGLILSWLMTIIAGAIAALIAFASHLSYTTILALYIALLSQVLLVMTNILGTVFIADEKMIYDAATSIIARLLTIIFFFIVVYYKLGLMGFFVALLLANALGLFLVFLILYYKFFKLKWGFNIQNLIYIFKEAFPLALSSFLYQGYTYINVFQLKMFCDLVQVSLFQAPQRIIAPLLMVPTSFLYAAVPTLSRLAHSFDTHSSLQYAYRKMLKYIIIISIPISIYGTIDALRLVSILFGKQFSAAAISFQLLVWAIMPIFVNSLLGFLLTSMKKQRAFMISNIICLIANLAAGFILVPHYGHSGASLAFLISSFVFLMVNFYYISKYLEVVPLHRMALQPLVAGAVMFIFLFLLANKFNMAMSGISAFLIYFGVLYISGTFTPDEIELFKSAIPARFKKGKDKISF
jgi:O-antigen/teichoic acid export membrane protein